MTDTTSFWWQALQKAGHLIYNAGEGIVADQTREQIERKLQPVLTLLEDPTAERAFDRAFNQAADAFTADNLPAEESEFRRDLVGLLRNTTRKEIQAASRAVMQQYVLASEPDRSALDWWVRRQLVGNEKFRLGERDYPQKDVTEALDLFFTALRRAFWDEPTFREQSFQSDTVELLRQILGELRPQVDLALLREDYLDYLRRRLQYLDLGGIAPKVANRTVKLAMRDIYVPIEAQKELDVKQMWREVSRFLTKLDEPDSPARLSGIGLLSGSELTQLDDIDVDLLLARLAGEGESAAFDFLKERFGGRGEATETASIRDIFATPRAVLLGHPGTGKSTTLRYAAYAIAAGLDDLVDEALLDRIPILVRLVDFAEAWSDQPTLSLRDYVRDAHDKDRAALFKHCLESGTALVMLDGLDEVIDPRQRAEIADQVEALVADYPHNAYLIASRIVGYQAGRLTGDFTHFTIGRLPESSIRGFIEQWYEAIEQEGGPDEATEARARAGDLVKAIEQRPGIRRLAGNPLLLTIIALVNWKGRRLPNRRVEVYRYAAETLAESWPARWRDWEFDAEEILSLLAPVAYRLFSDRSSEEIGQSELLPLLAQAVAEIKPGMTPAAAQAYVAELLPKLSEHSGLFLEQGYDTEREEPVYGFLHLTFGEYLAARYLAGEWEAFKDDGARRAFLARYAHVPRWQEVVLLMVQQIGLDGRRVPATQVLSDILQMETPYEVELHRNLLLAGQCLADDLRVEPPAAAWVLDQLAALILETPIRPLQEHIAALDRDMANTTYAGAMIERLLMSLVDDSAEVRARAAEALGRIGSEQAVEDLLARLDDDSRVVRDRAAGALEQIDRRVVRDRAAGTLVYIGSEYTVEELLARLDNDNDEVRVQAAEALGQIGSKDVIEGLIARLDDDNIEVGFWAAKILGQIGSKEVIEGLLARLADSNLMGRVQAAKVLGQIGSKDAVEGLLTQLDDDNDEVRFLAAKELGQSGSAYAVEGLLARLDNDNDEVRVQAAEALGQIGSKKAVEGLLARLDDDNDEVRARAVVALGQIGSERAVDGLLTRLANDNNWVVRADAALGLGQIGNEQVVNDLLARLTHDSDQVVRARAAEALAQIGDEQIVEGLLTHLTDPNDRVRATVADTLGQIGSKRAEDDLLTLLTDENPNVRVCAANALGRIGSERAVDKLLARLEQENTAIRGSMARALGQIGNKRVVDGLLTWLLITDKYGFPSGYQPACDWAYTTILEILAKHAPDPEVATGPVAEAAGVEGPWNK